MTAHQPARATAVRLGQLRLTAACLCAAVGVAASWPAHAQPRFDWALEIPWSGGNGQTYGDLVVHDGEATAVYSRPDAASLRLFLYRLAADGGIALAREVGDPSGIYYEPSLCWDGARYAVVASSYTRGNFLFLSAAGDALLPTTPLPSIPFGGRTAAFRVRCTAAGYAVFGLLLEPEFPGSANYYTHLHYWLLDGAGATQVDRDLGILLAPIAYPGFEGAEKEYYDVAWNGAGFLVAYAAECGTPATFQACYRTIDLAGNTVRPEAPASTAPTQGPHLATNGIAIGLATLRQNAFPGGNNLFARFFDLDGEPRGPELRYDDPALPPTGYAPVIVAFRGGFLAAYVQPDPYTLDYRITLAPFGAEGAPLAAATPVGDPLDLVEDTINLGVDLQLAADGGLLVGKGQAGVIQISPIVFRIPEPESGALALAMLVALAGLADASRTKSSPLLIGRDRIRP